MFRMVRMMNEGWWIRVSQYEGTGMVMVVSTRDEYCDYGEDEGWLWVQGEEEGGEKMR